MYESLLIINVINLAFLHPPINILFYFYLLLSDVLLIIYFFIFSATKTDLRCASDSPMVTYSEGKKLQRKIKAVKYMECSALENNGLTEIFTESVRASIKKHPSKTRNCNVF